MPKAIQTAYSHWTPLQQTQFNNLMLDFEKFCQEGSMIIDKNGASVSFKLNEAQKEVAEIVLRAVFAEIPSPTSIFIHKSRQMGISVIIAKLEQYICTRIKNFNAQHVMPTEEDAEDLCEKKFEPLLEGTHFDLLPKVYVTKRRARFKEFDDVMLNSSVTFSSAQKQSANKGQTNQMVVEDEHAEYERVNQLERGILATMPKAGRALRIVVSTAKGVNHFYDLSKIAEHSTHWEYRFLPWHMLKEYEMEPTGRLKELSSLTPYEVFLCDIFEEHGYPVESWARKMQWYEYTLHSEAKMDQEHMFENYPSTAKESFQATGSPVLPDKKLREFQEEEKSFKYVELYQDPRTYRYSLRETNLSTIKQFAEPIKGRKYKMSVDPADGGEDGDNSSVVLVDMQTMQPALTIKEKIDQNELAELINQIGRMYNNAEIIPERNTGQSLIDWLVMLKYPRMYIDPFHTTKKRVVYGVYMTRPVKNEAITRLKFLMNKGIYKDYDKDFIDEGLHFVWKKTPSGLQKAIGTEGFGDDCVMARLIFVSALDMSKYKDYNKPEANNGNQVTIRRA